MSGEKEWLDTTNLNVYTICIDDAVLTYIEGLPQLFLKDLEVVGGHEQLFMEGAYGDAPVWVVRPYLDVCE